MNNETNNNQLNEGSIVSYPVRYPLWGDAKYPGNCDGQLFNELLARYMPRTVADPMEGSGTIRDVVASWNRTTKHQVVYWGSDLRKGFNLLKENLPGRYDLVWIHPPYWNIIRYSQTAGDLSNLPSYDEYRVALAVCLRRCYAALSPGGRLAVLVADIRKQGRYTPIVKDILDMQSELGQLRGILIKAQHNCRSDSIAYYRMEDPRIQHEYCVLFKKDFA